MRVFQHPESFPFKKKMHRSVRAHNVRNVNNSYESTKFKTEYPLNNYRRLGNAVFEKFLAPHFIFKS